MVVGWNKGRNTIKEQRNFLASELDKFKCNNYNGLIKYSKVDFRNYYVNRQKNMGCARNTSEFLK